MWPEPSAGSQRVSVEQPPEPLPEPGAGLLVDTIFATLPLHPLAPAEPFTVRVGSAFGVFLETWSAIVIEVRRWGLG